MRDLSSLGASRHSPVTLGSRITDAGWGPVMAGPDADIETLVPRDLHYLERHEIEELT